MKHVVTLAAAALLVGCAHETTITRTVPVEVPVAVPCEIEEPAEPVWALSEIEPDASIFEKVRAAVIEINQRRAYEAQLKAALSACR